MSPCKGNRLRSFRRIPESIWRLVLSDGAHRWPDAMALAWMNGLGVRQMVGYTVVTWYGYGGWGVLDYFTEQPGRYTLAEAFHANHHALIHRLDRHFDGITGVALEPGSQRLPAVDPNPAGKQLGLSALDCRGLLWDRDTVAFYGDPAWKHACPRAPRRTDRNLEVQGDTYTLTITPQKGPCLSSRSIPMGPSEAGDPSFSYLTVESRMSP